MSVVPDGLGEDRQPDVISVGEVLVGPFICGHPDGGVQVGRGLRKVWILSRLRRRGDAPAAAGIVLRGAKVEEESGFLWVGYASPLRQTDVHGFPRPRQGERRAVGEEEASDRGGGLLFGWGWCGPVHGVGLGDS